MKYFEILFIMLEFFIFLLILNSNLKTLSKFFKYIFPILLIDFIIILMLNKNSSIIAVYTILGLLIIGIDYVIYFFIFNKMKNTKPILELNVIRERKLYKKFVFIFNCQYLAGAIMCVSSILTK